MHSTLQYDESIIKQKRKDHNNIILAGRIYAVKMKTIQHQINEFKNN